LPFRRDLFRRSGSPLFLCEGRLPPLVLGRERVVGRLFFLFSCLKFRDVFYEEFLFSDLVSRRTLRYEMSLIPFEAEGLGALWEAYGREDSLILRP